MIFMANIMNCIDYKIIK